MFHIKEFKVFTQRYGIVRDFSPPYHPATNREAKRFVQSFKTGLVKETGYLPAKLDKWLMAYHSVPHATTGVSPTSKVYW